MTKTGAWMPRKVEGFADGTILYDGVCVLCSRWFHFVASRDPDIRFRFTAIQEPLGLRLASALGIDPDTPETNAAVVNGVGLMMSDAAILVLSSLPGWHWFRVFSHVPRPLRDGLYSLVARNRYRIFGRTEACMIPDENLRQHMADQR